VFWEFINLANDFILFRFQLKDEITPAAAEARSKGATAEEIRQKTLDLIALCGDDKQLLTVPNLIRKH
jgi:hypothetical protein